MHASDRDDRRLVCEPGTAVVRRRGDRPRYELSDRQPKGTASMRADDVGRGRPGDGRQPSSAISRCVGNARRRWCPAHACRACRPGRGRPAAAGEPCQASVAALVRRLQALADEAQRLVEAMDFGFLFDPVRKLFSIGFRVREGALDPSYYDLLASEARLTSFVAIAKGDVERRPLVPSRSGADTGRPRLRADLVVRLDVRVPDAVARDARPGRQPARADLAAGRRPPDPLRRRAAACRGASPSPGTTPATSMQTYQYSGFGVPGLALEAWARRGPGRRTVRHSSRGDDRSGGRRAQLRPL